MSWLITWDRVEPLGGKGRQLVEKVGEWHVKSRHLQGCSPRLCRLRIDGLAPVSKYWTYRSQAGDMRPVNLVAYHRQKLGCSPLLHWLLWERSWVRARKSIGRHAVNCVGSHHSRWQWICSNLSMTHERLPRTGTAHRKCTPGVHGLAWKAYVPCWSSFPLQGVHRFESSRLSNMSNSLFVTVIT
jgi:hypothetical protein